MTSFRFALAAFMASAATAASAQSANDARCIVLSSAFVRAGPDDHAKQLAQASLYFYLGRVSPTASPAQLKSLFDQQMATITDKNDGQLMGECIKTFQAAVQRLDSVANQGKPVAKPSQPEGR